LLSPHPQIRLPNLEHLSILEMSYPGVSIAGRMTAAAGDSTKEGGIRISVNRKHWMNNGSFAKRKDKMGIIAAGITSDMCDKVYQDNIDP
jgi:hypothetical protein